MSHKVQIISNLHKVFRSDSYINNLLGVAGERLDNYEKKAEGLEKEFWFDSMSALGIAILEDQLAYNTMSNTLEGKREELEGRWKTSGKCDLKLLQTIANSWRNGEVAVLFTNACIKVTFISIIGIPRDVEVLKSAINEAKPAHLPIEYTFRYRTWGNLLENNWRYYKQFTWGQVLRREGI
ncbi:MAG: putative phage tail protein [Fusobacteriaceae bacterium]|uniref:putative phage tail protein n=1 Tax=Cetobacterium sp. ZWU0022 TaxID=1340502 RepID=UPI000647AED6|nr:putative phage tail protein [Cetobacterium sp. ZWU0022]